MLRPSCLLFIIRTGDTTILIQMLQGPCTISSEKKRIAWFSVYGDVMEIYDYPANYLIILAMKDVDLKKVMKAVFACVFLRQQWRARSLMRIRP